MNLSISHRTLGASRQRVDKRPAIRLPGAKIRQRHQNQLSGVFAAENKEYDPSSTSPVMQYAMPRRPNAMQPLNPGGQAEVDYDYQDFMPKDRTNEIDPLDVSGLDEKRALTTEPLGQARAQGLFPADQREAQAVMNSSRGGSWE